MSAMEQAINEDFCEEGLEKPFKNFEDFRDKFNLVVSIDQINISIFSLFLCFFYTVHFTFCEWKATAQADGIFSLKQVK